MGGHGDRKLESLCVAFCDCGTVSHVSFTSSRVIFLPEGQAGCEDAILWPSWGSELQERTLG